MDAKPVETEFIGNEPFPRKTTSVDLKPVSIGSQTFSNPCFWILLGIGAGVGIVCLLNHYSKPRK